MVTMADTICQSCYCTHMKTKKLIEKVVPQLFAIDQQKGSLQAEDVYLVVEQTGLAEENIRTLGVQIINKMLAEHGLEIQQGITINDLIADAVSDLYLMNENGTLELDDVYDALDAVAKEADDVEDNPRDFDAVELNNLLKPYKLKIALGSFDENEEDTSEIIRYHKNSDGGDTEDIRRKSFRDLARSGHSSVLSHEQATEIFIKINNYESLMTAGLFSCLPSLKYFLEKYDYIRHRQSLKLAAKLKDYIIGMRDEEFDPEKENDEISAESEEMVDKAVIVVRTNVKELERLYYEKPINWRTDYTSLLLDTAMVMSDVKFTRKSTQEMYDIMSSIRDKLSLLENEYHALFARYSVEETDSVLQYLNLPVEDRSTNYWVKRFPNAEKGFLDAVKRLDIRYMEIQNELGGIEPTQFKTVFRKQIDIGYRGMKKYKDIFATHNIRLVVETCKKIPGAYMDIMGFEQEGKIGLMNAIDRFDHTRGFKFSTYAVWWIRQAAVRYRQTNSRTIRLPAHQIELYNDILRFIQLYEHEHSREPTATEIAEHFDIALTVVQNLINLNNSMYSVENDVSEDGETRFIDLIEDENTPAPDENLMKEGLHNALEDAIDRLLTPKEQVVIRRQFGLGQTNDYSLKEIGQELNVTRERVRQIKAKALKKLKTDERLRDFL